MALYLHHSHGHNEADMMHIIRRDFDASIIAKTPSNEFRPACQDQSGPDLHGRSQHLLSLRLGIQHHRVQLSESYRLVVESSTGRQRSDQRCDMFVCMRKKEANFGFFVFVDVLNFSRKQKQKK